MKKEFNITNEFHNMFEEGLDNIMNTKDKTGKNRMVRRASTIAASLIILLVVSLFTASATGIINLDTSFKTMFGIENDKEAQEYALKLSSAPVAQSTTGDISARVLQSINDENGAYVIIELESKNKNLNHSVLPEEYELKVADNKLSTYEFLYEHGPNQKKQTIQEAEIELNELKKSNYTLYDNVIPEMLKEQEKQIEFEQAMTNKITLILELTSEQSMLGKEISFSVDKLRGFIRKDNWEDNEDFNIDCDINLKWKLSNEAKTKTVKVNKEYNGAMFKEIKLMPLQINVTFSKPIYNINEDYSNIYFKGFKYKDGTTEAVNLGSGSVGNDDYVQKYAKAIINIDEIASIYVGDNFTEIPIQ